MSKVNPPSPPPTTQPVQSVEHLKAVIINPPESFSRQISRGVRFNAEINSNSQKGHYEIQTPFGRVTIQTKTNLPNVGNLQLQLISKGKQLQLLITTINGLPPLTAMRALGLLPTINKNSNEKTFATTKARNLTKDSSQINKIKSTPNSRGVEGEQLRITKSVIGKNLIATLLNTPTSNSTIKAPLTEPSETLEKPYINATSRQKNYSVQRTPSLPAISNTRNTVSRSGKLTPKNPSDLSIISQTTNKHFSTSGKTRPLPGSQLIIRILAYQNTPTTGVVTQEKAGGGHIVVGSTLTGTVIGTTKITNHPIIQTHVGTLTIATSTFLPNGSQVSFEVQDYFQNSPKSNNDIKLNEQYPSQILNREWPALQEALRFLNEVNPAAAQQLTQAVLPHPGPALGGNIVFFLLALTSGNLSHWFGDFPIRSLKLYKPELLERLKKDFGEIERISRIPSAKEWRTILIPFHDGSEVNPLKFSIRNLGEEKRKELLDDNGATNFIIDLNINNLGRLQLDGLVYREKKRLDLVVRTNIKLSKKIEDGIRDIFQNANDAINLMGGVVFQSPPCNFIEPTDSRMTDHPDGLFV